MMMRQFIVSTRDETMRANAALTLERGEIREVTCCGNDRTIELPPCHFVIVEAESERKARRAVPGAFRSRVLKPDTLEKLRRREVIWHMLC